MNHPAASYGVSMETSLNAQGTVNQTFIRLEDLSASGGLNTTPITDSVTYNMFDSNTKYETLDMGSENDRPSPN